MTDVTVVDAPAATVGGVPVRRLVPQEGVPAVGPWTFADLFGPAVLRQPRRRQRGVQSLTWLFQGQLRHSDTLGTDTTFGPGEVVMVTAGDGVGVEQGTEGDAPASGLALRLTVPDGAHAEAGVEEFWPEPVRVGDHEVAILVGEFGFEDSPVVVHAPAFAAEVRFASDDPLPVDAPDGWEYLVVGDDAPLVVEGVEVPAGRAAVVRGGSFGVAAAASAGRVVRAVLIGGAAVR